MEFVCVCVCFLYFPYCCACFPRTEGGNSYSFVLMLCLFLLLSLTLEWVGSSWITSQNSLHHVKWGQSSFLDFVIPMLTGGTFLGQHTSSDSQKLTWFWMTFASVPGFSQSFTRNMGPISAVIPYMPKVILLVLPRSVTYVCSLPSMPVNSASARAQDQFKGACRDLPSQDGAHFS